MIGIIALAGMANAPVVYSWRDIVQPDFHDCTFEAKVLQKDQRALDKISKDFAYSFRFTYMKAEVKEPFMVRLESNVAGTELLYVENGDRKAFRIPKIRISKVENDADSPGKRQTVLDFGVLTPSLFETLFDAQFVRTDRETGDLVFDLTFKNPPFHDKTRQRVWVDPQRRYVAKRVWFAQDGHEMASFDYESPTFQNGVWFPSKAVVKDVDGDVAGVTAYSKMNVNVGLSDKPFQF